MFQPKSPSTSLTLTDRLRVRSFKYKIYHIKLSKYSLLAKKKNDLYTFDENELLKLLLLQNFHNYFFLTLGIYLLAKFLLYVTLFYILRLLVGRFDNHLILIILSVIQNPLVITTALFAQKTKMKLIAYQSNFD